MVMFPVRYDMDVISPKKRYGEAFRKNQTKHRKPASVLKSIAFEKSRSYDAHRYPASCLSCAKQNILVIPT